MRAEEESLIPHALVAADEVPEGVALHGHPRLTHPACHCIVGPPHRLRTVGADQEVGLLAYATQGLAPLHHPCDRSCVRHYVRYPLPLYRGLCPSRFPSTFRSRAAARRSRARPPSTAPR